MKLNNNNNKAVITGLGVCVPGSLDSKSLLNNLLTDKSPLQVHKLGDEDIYTSKFSEQEIQQVKSLYDGLDISNLDIKVVFLLKAIDEALAMAGIKIEDLSDKKVSLVFASCQVGLEKVEEIAKSFIQNNEHSITNQNFLGVHYSYVAKFLSNHFKIGSSVVGFSSACAASNNALGYAKDLIGLDSADIVLVVSIDTYAISTTAGFYALQAQVPYRTNPFGSNVGLNLGEGCGVIVLQNANTVKQTAELNDKWVLAGYGLSGDSYHITTPRPDGMGANNSMTEAIRDANIDISDIEYVKAHGTGTAANDVAESKAIYDVFGENMYVSSLKSFLGHTLGSSGIIEIISFIILNNNGYLPPNYGFNTIRDNITKLNYLPNEPIKKSVSTIMANSFAFGGQNSSCVLQRYPKIHASHKVKAQDPIYINASGIYNKLGSSNQQIFNSLANDEDCLTFNEESGLWGSVLDNVKLTEGLASYNRNCKQAKLMISSLKEILEGNSYLKNNFNAGLVAGVLSSSAEASEKYMNSVFVDKPTLASAYYFPMNTLNTMAGVSSIAHSIIGYNTNILGSIGAFIYSMSLFSSNRQQDILLTSADDMTNFMLSVHNLSDYAKNTSSIYNQKNGLCFADSSTSFLLSREKTQNSVEIMASKTLSLAGLDNNINPYEDLIQSILDENGVNIDELDLVVITSREIDYKADLLDKALLKYFANKSIVTSIDDKLGYGFSISFLNALWFGYQSLLNKYAPYIKNDKNKSYCVKEDKNLNSKSKIMVLSGDITGNAIALLLAK